MPGITRRLSLPSIGPSSKEIVKKDEVLIEKVNTLMTKLKSPIMSAEFRESTPLRPVNYVVTR